MSIGWDIIVLGAGAAGLVAAFRAAARRPPDVDLTGLSLPGLAAGLSHARLLVTGDTGPAHLAAAVGTPALVLFGPTSPRRWGPPAPGRALSLGLACAPCSNHGDDRCPLGHHRCLADLSTERVLAEAMTMLGETR